MSEQEKPSKKVLSIEMALQRKNSITQLDEDRLDQFDKDLERIRALNAKLNTARGKSYNEMLEKKHGPSSSDLATIVAGAFLGYPEAIAIVGQPALDYLITQDISGVRSIYTVTADKVVTLVARDWLISKVSSFCSSLLVDRGALENVPTFTDTTKRAIVNEIIGTSPTVDPTLFKPFDWLGGSEYCYHRLNFAPDATKPTPLFDSMVERIKTPTQRANFLAILGSLFDLDHRLEKYLWLYGSGGDGKGSLFSLISHIFGDACTTFVTDSKKIDKYWSATFVGKRVGIATDVGNHNIIHSEAFKTLTGDTNLSVRRMRSETTSVINNVILLMGSNEIPNIKFDEADKRRAIFVELLPKKCPYDPTFKTRLHQEAAGIVGKVMETWGHVKQQNNGLISEDIDTLTELADENTAHFEDAFHKIAAVDSDASCGAMELYQRLSLYLKDMSNSSVQQREFKRWLEIRFGIKQTRLSHGNRTRTYHGIKLKQMY